MKHFHEGVEYFPDTPRRGQEVTINYNGILAKHGADAIWMHYGYDNWQGSNYQQMEKIADKFTCKIEAEGRRNIDFCFKDSANNWDNNNGLNWGCPIK
jgi:hypothetical protein